MPVASCAPKEKRSGESQLRKQRNYFAAAAIVCIVLAMAVSVPRKLMNHRELKALNDEIVSLQAAIGVANAQLRSVQTEIGKGQQEIANQLKR